MIQYPFTAYPLIAVVSLMFLLPAILYLLWLGPKSAATRNLIAFLFCTLISLAAMYLHNALFFQLTPLWPLQDAALVVGGFCMARFAYTFPRPERSKEARRVVGVFAGMAFFAVAWLLLETWRYLQDPYGFVVSPAFWGLMPTTVLLLIALFLRRMVALSAPVAERTEAGLARLWQILRHPPNRDAQAHRAFALAMLSGLVQAAGSLVDSQLLPAESLIALGTLLTLSLLLLAYLNATASANTLIVRLVGAVLIVFLAVMGAVGSQALRSASSAYWSAQLRLQQVVAQALDGGTLSDYPDTLLYVASFPASRAVDAAQIDFLYTTPDPGTIDAQALRREIQRMPFSDKFEASHYDEMVRVERLPDGRGSTAVSFLHLRGDQVLELGFVYSGRNAESHGLVSRLMWQIVLGTAVILFFLPLVFRSTLIVPLQRLLQGVQRVNDGEFEVFVPIRIDDEIGFLTHSFNRMTRSLYELTEGLEQRVRERTQSLREEIVERRRVQAELEIATKQAEEANQAKSIFLANMSHELRTPLNAILGYAELLQEQTPRPDHPASIIERSGRHLLSLINGVLDLARIEAGKTELNPEPVALVDFLQRVSDLAAIQARAKGLAFRVETELAPSVTVLVDGTRLRQVLLNLLSNGVSYTDAGEVVLRVGMEESAPDGQSGRFHFSVADTGLGIDPREQALIFQPMYQTDPARRRGKGTGLGLAISAQLVGLMGGQIRVQSRPGQGSTFAFALDLPLDAHPAQAAPPRRRRLLGDRAPRVLVIDDNPENRTLVADRLQPLGFAVVGMAARPGLQAALHEPFDLVITDLLMADLSGLELIRALRGHAATAALPIIATSASVFPQDRARSIEAGADAFIEKPIAFPALLEQMDRLLALEWLWESAPRQAVAGEASAALPPAPILKRLLGLARAGDILALRQTAQELETQATSTHFAARLQALIGSYQVEKIVAWLETIPMPLPESSP